MDYKIESDFYCSDNMYRRYGNNVSENAAKIEPTSEITKPAADEDVESKIEPLHVINKEFTQEYLPHISSSTLHWKTTAQSKLNIQ